MINEEAKAFIAENYDSMNPKEIAEFVGRSQDWVRQEARKMGMFRGKGYRGEKHASCKECMIFCNNTCLARLDSCGAAKYTKASWSQLLKPRSRFD